MKKFTSVLACFLVTALIFGLLPLTALAEDNLAGKRILFFGDSITELGGSSRYTELLKSEFKNTTIINAGKAGNSTYDARLRFESAVLSEKADIVFICFGMNDQAIQTNGTPIKTKERYRTNIQNFITALKNAGTDVVLMTPHPVCLETETGRTNPNYRKGDLAGYCDILRELAIENGCGLVDMYSEFSLYYNSKAYIYDGLHQTAEGHKIYSKKIADYLNAVYNNLNKATVSVKCNTEGGTNIYGYDLVGANGASVKLTVPALNGYTALSSPKTISLETKTIGYEYSAPWEAVLATAYSIDRSEYKAAVLGEIDYYINLCMTAEGADVKSFAASQLEYLITLTGDAELVYSTNLAYTTNPDPNYFLWDSAAGAPSTTLNPLFVDDNVRLTDGKKGNTDGANNGGLFYSVWQGSDVTVTIDLGKAVNVDLFRAYFAGGVDGVERPRKMKVAISENGVDFTDIKATCNISEIGADGEWDTYLFVIQTQPVKARFVSFTISAQLNYGAKCVWVDELEVALADTSYLPPSEDKENQGNQNQGGNASGEYKLGDVNKSGEIDSMDYVLVKRAYFGTFSFDAEQLSLGDVNKSGEIDSMDYVLIKRAYFGTFTIR